MAMMSFFFLSSVGEIVWVKFWMFLDICVRFFKIGFICVSWLEGLFDSCIFSNVSWILMLLCSFCDRCLCFLYCFNSSVLVALS